MKNLHSNIHNKTYIDVFGEQTYTLGEELIFLPKEETEANFCTLETIHNNNDIYNITLAIENEWTGKKYKKSYSLQKGSKLKLNMLTPNLACFLPPNRIPVLVEINNISSTFVTFKTINILKKDIPAI